MGGGRVRRGADATQAQEAERGAGVLRHQLHQPEREGGTDQLAGPDPDGPPDLEPAGLERLRVELRQDPALGEVERRDGDGVVIDGARRRRRGRTTAAATSEDAQGDAQ